MVDHISDAAARKLALNPTRSFIVQAPAGSGKTSLLVERYLALLMQVTQPEEIVAITFTRKAAHEILSRVIAKLSQAPTHQDQKHHHYIMQNPNCLRIQTIDAFCSYLISRAPIFTKTNLNFKVVQNQEAELYYSKAAQIVLTNTAEAPYAKHLECLLLHLDNDWERAERLLVTMLKSREQWLPHIVGLKNTAALRHTMELALQETAQENIEQCFMLFPQPLQQELIATLKLAQANYEQLPPLLQAIRYENNYFKKDLSCWQSVARLLLTQHGSWRKKVTKEQGFPAPTPHEHQTKKELLTLTKARMEAVLAECEQHEQLRLGLEHLLLSPPPTYSEQQWQIIEALLKLLPLLAAHLKVIYDEELVTDHAEIVMAALRALEEQDQPTTLALNLDYQLHHLLIDEFQDTSLSHYRLIEKLITTWQPDEGRTIFIVGDPMQSIYRFREAEVGLFLRVVQDGIGNLKPQLLTLTTNFRSSHNILNWINTNFAKILPPRADISLGAVPFKPATAIINNPQSLVTVTLLKEGTDELEAAQVIATIQKIQQQAPQESIAILARARPHLQKIIPALRQANLRYQAYELETLNETMVIRDLFTLTRALFDLTDRIAWLAILRAPWCGVTLEDLHKIANGPEELIWDNISNFAPLQLSTDGEARLIRLKLALLPMLDLKARVSWHELVEKAWLRLGGPATVTDKIELEYAAVYLELLNTPTLNMALLQKKLSSLYTPSTSTPANIQLMTIHKAKGLEFDHVIIPGINRLPRFDEHQLLLWFERPKLHQGSSLLLAPIAMKGNETDYVYRYLRAVEHKKEYYETGRLLYVAMTRAKISIHLVGNITTATTIPTGSLLAQLKSCFQESWVQEKLPHLRSNLSPPPSAPGITRLSSDWHLPITIDIPLIIENAGSRK